LNQLNCHSFFFSHHLAETPFGLDVTDKVVKHETRCKIHLGDNGRQPNNNRKKKKTPDTSQYIRCSPTKKKKKEREHLFCRSEPILSQEGVPSVVSFSLQGADLFLQLHNELVRSIHGGHQVGPLPFPTVQTVDFGGTPTKLGFDFFTEPAITPLVFGHVDEPHSACFAGAVLIVASVSKAGPAPVPTRKSLLVVKAHAYQID
jgi:hypothetical protein